MAENLTTFLKENSIKVRYMHSDIDTLERIEIITALRKGDFDVLVGINLLREGLDLPEVKLVVILDADKEGFLRSETALIQTVGRAARNTEGRVIMYADVITGSMQRTLNETARRRGIQTDYNKAHNITPKTIVKDIVNTIEITKKLDKPEKRDRKDIVSELERLKGLMQVAADSLDFEAAIKLRDRVSELKQELRGNKKN
jgi:Helicase subunit of the DNA excision repair complex